MLTKKGNAQILCTISTIALQCLYHRIQEPSYKHPRDQYHWKSLLKYQVGIHIYIPLKASPEKCVSFHRVLKDKSYCANKDRPYTLQSLLLLSIVAAVTGKLPQEENIATTTESQNSLLKKLHLILIFRLRYAV